jgi:O-acetyl-ADP-ribose deacetylase (regulator of RNase III)
VTPSGIVPTTFLAGDLFRANLPALAHGCNCAGAMGKGIAVEFRSRFPARYAEYKQRCATKRFTPGDVFAWKEGDVTIYNLGTQKTWRTPATLSAIEASVTEMVRLADAAGITRVGLPRIGAGLGGLAWTDVRAFLATVGASASVELVVFEDYKP